MAYGDITSAPMLAADTLDLQSSGTSPVTDAIFKGIPSAAISGALSVYNTFLDYGGKDQVDVHDAIQSFDPDTAQYYSEHKETIDMAGFIGTSLIPGSLGMKGLKMLQAGKADGIFARFTGFAASRKDQYLSKALGQMAETGGTITSDIIASRRAQMAWATADNLLTSAAAETAIALTMNDSPIFENATFGDFVKNAALGAVFGGAIGGLLDNLAARGVLKQAQKSIEGKMRPVDTIFVPKDLNVDTATKIGNVLDQIIYRPETDFSIPFAYRVPGSKLTATQDLDISQALKSSRNRTEKVAFDTVAEHMNDLAEGAAITGQAFHGMIYKTIQDMRVAGEADDAISETVRGYLNVKRIGALADNEADLVTHPETFFLNKKPTSFSDLFQETRGKGTGKQAYSLTTTDSSLIKTAGPADGFKSVWEAFAAGFDVAIGASGQMVVNPKSKYIVRTKDAALDNRFYVDLPSGQLNRDIIVTGADTLKRDSDFIRLADEVIISGKRFKQAAMKEVSTADSALATSARYMWAKNLTPAEFNNRTILWNDFPVLDRMRELGATALNGKKAPEIILPSGGRLSYNEIVDPTAFVNEHKLQWFVQQLEKTKKADGTEAGRDIRLWANELNVPRDWIEQAQQSGFAPTRDLMGSAQPLASYFNPKTVRMEWNNSLPQVVKQDGSIPSWKDVNGINGPAPNHMVSTILADKYRVQTALDQSRNAFFAVFGTDAQQFMQLSERLSQRATSTGAGAGAFTSSNAGYGDAAELFCQDTGKALHLLQGKLRDETIGAMMGDISAIRASKEAAAELGILTTALRRDARKYVFFEDETGRRMIDRDAVAIYRKSEGSDNPMTIDECIDALKMRAAPGELIRGEYKITNPEVESFLVTNRDINAQRLAKSTVLLNATGLRVTRDPEVIYVPPIDTARYPHHAFVVAKERVGAATDVSMITAKDAEQLRKLAGEVGDDFDVVYDTDVLRYYKAKGHYDYDMTMHESKVNSSLQRKGKLSDFFPETKSDLVLEDFVRWHANCSDQLARTGVEVANRQFFNDMDWLARRWSDANESTAGGVGFLKSKTDANPFRDYAKTALNISKRNEFPVLDSLNEFVDKLGTEAYAAIDKAITNYRTAGADKATELQSMVSLNKANELIEQYGLGTPYATMQNYLTANEGIPKNLIKVAFQKANLFLATGVLRLDLANALVNTISTPIMLGTELGAIRSAIGKDAGLAGKLDELMKVQVPGRDVAVPSNTRLIGNAIKNFFGPDKLALLNRYKANGDVKEVLTLYHEVLDDLSYLPNQAAGTWSSKVSAAVEKGAQITGNNFAEEFTRFVSADVMRQLTDPVVKAGKMDLQEANAYISSFVNRVQGNYVSSQRPVMFQGTTGAAVGLFQTYSVNVLQQLFRHMEDRNTAALLSFAGLQTSVYGLNGLPFFDAINQHLIGTAAGNIGHKDAYSFLPAANKEYGDWLLYGTASAFPLLGERAPALYSRGDINPRHLSIVPINPVDIPAVQASIKVVDSVMGFAKSVSNGGDLTNSFLFALEHHGINRPLAGFAQVMQGRSTTAQGSLISAANDMHTTSMLAAIPERLVNFGGISRIMGAKPMDEAVALNNMYRDKAYDAVDRARINDLGAAVKTKLYANQAPTGEEMGDFMASYMKAGGRIENFSSTLQHWQKDANQSVVNQVASHLRTMKGQRLQEAMGGTRLQDYSSMPQDDSSLN
jgi:hypothetical protein